jgi:hypothetical protein
MKPRNENRSEARGASAMVILNVGQDLLMSTYQYAAILAANRCRANSERSPGGEWVRAVARAFPSSESSRTKACPRGAFLGLCEDGLVIGVPPGRYTRSAKNKAYAIAAIRLLRREPSLASDIPSFWCRVMRRVEEIQSAVARGRRLVGSGPHRESNMNKRFNKAPEPTAWSVMPRAILPMTRMFKLECSIDRRTCHARHGRGSPMTLGETSRNLTLYILLLSQNIGVMPYIILR